MSVPSPEKEGGGFGVGQAIQPCKKVSATETASSTVSQIYWYKDDNSGIKPAMKILNEIRKESYSESEIHYFTRSVECKNTIADGKVDPMN